MRTLREILKEKRISQREVADALGITPNNLPRFDDLTKRSIEEVIKIANIIGITPTELMNLNCENSIIDIDIKPNSEAQLMEQTMIMNVPLVNQYAYAGYLSGYQDASYLSQLPTLPFIVDHEAQGNYVAFEVKGDSMNDGTEESYIEGDRLLCREIPQHLWCGTKLHIRKWDFIIVHSEGILVKRIIDHDVENHTITIHSLNPLYQDRIIDLCDVRQIFNVVELQRPRRR